MQHRQSHVVAAAAADDDYDDYACCMLVINVIGVQMSFYKNITPDYTNS
jgi:hypothetical protein